jgi:murein DD-endopeptidase MepM/ murein hydrolase activator NlpD
MNSWRWRTGFLYVISGIILFGVSGLVFGNHEKIEPTGTEVSDQRIEEQESPKTEAERMRAELALVGIKTAETPKSTLKESAYKATTKQSSPILEAASRAEDGHKNIKDFPSPVQGKLIKGVGNYYSESLKAYLFHAGRDYAQSEGAVIRIKHSGKVTYAGPDPILGGKVEIDCGEDWSVIYGGLQNLRVKEGDPVEVNQAIGQIGYYPSADGVKDQPQLHFEVWHGDEVQIP